jgi:hypothetical protein
MAILRWSQETGFDWHYIAPGMKPHFPAARGPRLRKVQVAEGRAENRAEARLLAEAAVAAYFAEPSDRGSAADA